MGVDLIIAASLISINLLMITSLYMAYAKIKQLEQIIADKNKSGIRQLIDSKMQMIENMNINEIISMVYSVCK